MTDREGVTINFRTARDEVPPGILHLMRDIIGLCDLHFKDGTSPSEVVSALISIAVNMVSESPLDEEDIRELGRHFVASILHIRKHGTENDDRGKSSNEDSE